ncbi:uncharacterized protein V2V93DRAFT_372002 [Kockiozyma suomiensis]|uniref:uncharacterized protein n=1 Tax=Kockiozyma suomiensis TaxID=1337062 RepID=UPI003343A403
MTNSAFNPSAGQGSEQSLSSPSSAAFAAFAAYSRPEFSLPPSPVSSLFPSPSRNDQQQGPPRRIDPAKYLPPELFAETLTYIPFPFVSTLQEVSKQWRHQVSHYLQSNTAAFSYLDFTTTITRTGVQNCAPSMLSSASLSQLVQKSRGNVHTILLPRDWSSDHYHELWELTRMLFWRTLITYTKSPEGTDQVASRLSNLQVLSLNVCAHTIFQSWSAQIILPDVSVLYNLTDLSVPVETASQLIRFMARGGFSTPSSAASSGTSTPDRRKFSDSSALPSMPVWFPNLITLEFYYDTHPNFHVRNIIGANSLFPSMSILPKLREFRILGAGKEHKVVVLQKALSKLLEAMPVVESIKCTSCMVLSQSAHGSLTNDGVKKRALPGRRKSSSARRASAAGRNSIRPSNPVFFTDNNENEFFSGENTSEDEGEDDDDDDFALDLRRYMHLKVLDLSDSIIPCVPLLPKGFKDLKLANSWVGNSWDDY